MNSDTSLDTKSETSKIVNDWLDTLSVSPCESITSVSLLSDMESEEIDLEGFLSEAEKESLWANDEDPDWLP